MKNIFDIFYFFYCKKEKTSHKPNKKFVIFMKKML